MKSVPAMNDETWPEFVTSEEEDAKPRAATTQLTGWETVVFRLEDEEIDELLSGIRSTGR